MGTREDLLEKVAAARRRRAEAGREIDEVTQALRELDATRAPDVDAEGDEVVHPPGLRRVTVRG